MKNFFKKITLLFVIGISGSTVLAIDPNETPQSTQANHMQGNTRGRPQRRFYPGQNRSFRVMPQTPAQPAVYRTRPLSENQRALQQAQNIVAQIQQKQHQATLIHQVALMQPENHPFHAVLGAIQQTQAFAQRVVWPSIANLLNPITPFPIQNAAVQEELAELRNQIDETECSSHTAPDSFNELSTRC